MSDARAGGAYVEVSLRSKITEGAKKVQSDLNAVSKSLGTVGAALLGTGTATLAPLIASAISFGETGAAFDDVAQRTGLAGDAISELAHAADMSGTGIEALEKGVRKMQQTLIGAAEGSKTDIAALDALGLTVEDLAGKTGDQQFEMFAEALSQIEDPAERSSRAMDVFGKAGAELVPLLQEGSAGIQALREDARALGLQMSSEDVSAAAAFDDSLVRLKGSIKGIVLSIGGALAPTLTNASNLVTTIAAGTGNWIRENRGLVVAIAAVAIAAVAGGASLLAIAGGAVVASAAITAFGTIATTVGAVVGAVWSPVTLIVLGVAAAVGVVTAAFAVLAVNSGVAGDAIAYLKSVFGGITELATKTFGGIANALAGGNVQLAVKIFWAGLKVAFLAGLQEIVRITSQQYVILGNATVKFLNAYLKTWTEAFRSIPKLIKSIINGTLLTDIAQAVGVNFKFGGLEGAKAELDKLTAEAAALKQSQSSKAFDDRVKSLREEIATLRLGKDAADLLKLAQEGLSDAQLADVAALQAQRRAIEAKQKAEEEARKASEQAAEERKREAERLKEEGKTLAESLRTPREAFVAEVARIQKLLDAKAIDQTTANRALEKARKDLAGGTGSDGASTGSNTLAFRGSKEAALTIRRQAGTGTDPAARWVAPLVSNGLAQLTATRDGFSQLALAQQKQTEAVKLDKLEELTEKELAAMGLLVTDQRRVVAALQKQTTYSING
jgi:hypothetical protein